MATTDGLLFNTASFVAGLFLLEYGADKFIDHTAIVAKRLNVSPTLVGLLTCGAEWEELVVIIVALSQNQPSLALGNLMGSCVANILASFSLGLLFLGRSDFDRSSQLYTSVLLASTSLFLLLLLLLPASLKSTAGVFLLVGFVVYVVSVASLIYKGTLTAPEDSDGSDDESGTSDESDTDDEMYRPEPDQQAWQGKLAGKPAPLRRKGKPGPKPLSHHIFKLLLGLLALIIASYIVANSAGAIGSALQLSGTVVGTTILSLATTVPEKFVSVMGGVRKQPGIMVANTVGSNIFLVTLCGGIVFVGGDAQQLELGFTGFEALVMWIAALLIFGIVLWGGRSWMGGVMLTLYLGFLTVEFTHGRNIDND